MNCGGFCTNRKWLKAEDCHPIHSLSKFNMIFRLAFYESFAAAIACSILD